MTKNKLVCALIFITVFGLLLASCSQPQQTTGATQTSSVPTTTPGKTTSAPAPTTTASAEKPQYGGQILLGLSTNVVDFDEIYGFFGPPELNTIQMTNERLFTGDWTKGPAGTWRDDLVRGPDSVRDGRRCRELGFLATSATRGDDFQDQAGRPLRSQLRQRGEQACRRTSDHGGRCGIHTEARIHQPEVLSLRRLSGPEVGQHNRAGQEHRSLPDYAGPGRQPPFSA